VRHYRLPRWDPTGNPNRDRRSTSSEHVDHWREPLGVTDHNVADAEVGAQTLQLVDDLLDRTDQHERGLLDEFVGGAELLSCRAGGRGDVVTDTNHLHQR
jgi:hypothetical protein